MDISRGNGQFLPERALLLPHLGIIFVFLCISTFLSDESSGEDNKSPIEATRKPMPKISEQSLTVPTLRVTPDIQPRSSNELTIPSPLDESRPSTGHSVVSRKVSSLSNITRDTTERILNSLFSPITAFNRGRKRTKAEKRAHKAFRTITFIVGLFAILWSPYYVVVGNIYF